MTITEGTQRLPALALRSLFLFEKLSDDQLEWLAEHGWVVELPSGATVVEEGAPAEVFVVLLAGAITMTRRVGQDDMEMVRTDQVGVYAGAMQAYVRDGDEQTYSTSVRVVSDARFFVLRSEDFAWMMRTWFPMAIHLLEGLFLGMRTSQHIVGQRQQLLALGALSAGLTHELNNPAAAAVRATSALRDRVAGMRRKLAMLAHDKLDKRLLELLVDVQEEAVQAVSEARKLTAIQESERENSINDWVTRISSLVAAARQYSNMDRAPHERVDIHTGLDSTLVMLSSTLEHVEVVTDHDRSLPPVPVYAGELNQVWTNLIDNAVQAMDGHGRLTVRTAMDGDRMRVEIGDTGPGVPERLRQR